jgi:hypothetical protein
MLIFAIVRERLLMLFKILLISLSFSLIACGDVDRTNENLENTNRNVERLNNELFNAAIIVFEPDFVSPEKELEVEALPVRTESGSFLFSVKINELATYEHAVSGETYFLVPDGMKAVLPARYKKTLYPEGSLYSQVNDIATSIVDKAIEDLLNNKEFVVSFMTEALTQSQDIEEIRRCNKKLSYWGSLKGQLEAASFWQLGKISNIKSRLKNLEREEEFYYCKQQRNTKLLSSDEVKLFEKKLKQDWALFTQSWNLFFNDWKRRPGTVFTTYDDQNIILPTIVDPVVIGLREGLKESYAEQMSYLSIVKGRLMTEDLERFKKFIINNSGGLKIDPTNPFSFEKLSDEQFMIIQQMFERALYSGNTDDEALNVRRFIAEAVFVMYERQLLKSLIAKSKKSLKSKTSN